MARAKRIASLSAVVLVVLVTLLSSEALAASFLSAQSAFKVGSTVYKVGSTSTTWKSKLGKHTKKKYDGCTVGTTSYMYNFSGKGIKVETLVSGKKETIIGAVITGKTIATSKGLKVGHTVAKMTTLYGTGYSKSGNTYTYSAGGKKMVVNVSAKDKITKITLYQ